MRALSNLWDFEDVSVFLVEDLSLFLHPARGSYAPGDGRKASANLFLYLLFIQGEFEPKRWNYFLGKELEWFHGLFTSGIGQIWCLVKQMGKKYFS